MARDGIIKCLRDCGLAERGSFKWKQVDINKRKMQRSSVGQAYGTVVQWNLS